MLSSFMIRWRQNLFKAWVNLPSPGFGSCKSELYTSFDLYHLVRFNQTICDKHTAMFLGLERSKFNRRDKKTSSFTGSRRKYPKRSVSNVLWGWNEEGNLKRNQERLHGTSYFVWILSPFRVCRLHSVQWCGCPRCDTRVAQGVQ